MGFLFLLCHVAPGTVSAETLWGQVVNVADGDSVTVLDESRQVHKVRLSGIDAPEKKQDFGGRSRRSLMEMVQGKQVLVDTQKRDKYGRLVGKLLLQGEDVNLEQVRRGMAWHYTAYAKEQSESEQQSYRAAQTSAQVAQRGLWQERDPMPPWEWRHRDRRD